MPPAGFQVSPRDTTADTIDSDIDSVTGRTAITTLSANEDDLTWDAGFFAPVVSLGNRVWFDTNNDRLDNDGAGAVAGSSTGIPGVTVQLFFDANGDGQITGAEQNWLAQQTTDASGFYLFAAQTHSGGTALGSPVPLYPGQYVVGIAPSNFTGGGALAGYHSSGTTISTAGVIGEVVAPDPNNDTDRDDNGDTVRTPAVFYTGGVIGKPVFIDSSEPTGEPESAGNAPGPLPIADGSSNLTLDFGFYTTSLGNLVWVDDGTGGGTIANGLRDGGELGISGVTVRLFSQDNTTEIRVGPDGLLGTADDAAGGRVTERGRRLRLWQPAAGPVPHTDDRAHRLCQHPRHRRHQQPERQHRQRRQRPRRQRWDGDQQRSDAHARHGWHAQQQHGQHRCGQYARPDDRLRHRAQLLAGQPRLE